MLFMPNTSFYLSVLQNAWTVSHSWQDVPANLCFLLMFITPLAEAVSDHINSLGISHFFHSSSLMVNIYFWHTHVRHLFCLRPFLSIYYRMHKQSHTLGKTFNKTQLSVDIHHPLAEGVSSHVNSPGISHLFSQLISDGEYFYLTYVVYAYY